MSPLQPDRVPGSENQVDPDGSTNQSTETSDSECSADANLYRGMKSHDNGNLDYGAGSQIPDSIEVNNAESPDNSQQSLPASVRPPVIKTRKSSLRHRHHKFLVATGGCSLLVICVVITLLLPGAFNLLKSRASQAFLDRGISLAKNNNLNQAIFYWELSALFDPKNVYADYNLGYAYSEKGLLTLAISKWNQVIQIRPDSVIAYSNLGLLYFQLGKIGEAINSWQTVIQLTPTNADAYFNLGLAYTQKNDTQEAINNFNQCIQLRPRDAEAYKLRADAQLNRYAIELAIIDYSEAIELKPEYAEAYLGRGNAYINKGDWYGAIRNYDAALKLKPEFTEAYFKRGVAYAGLYQDENAAKDFNKVIELCGSDQRCQDAQNWLTKLAQRK
jgi:tetratricopeptide (TPR) repeat protein